MVSKTRVLFILFGRVAFIGIVFEGVDLTTGKDVPKIYLNEHTKWNFPRRVSKNASIENEQLNHSQYD
jgi:hypothetical protein